MTMAKRWTVMNKKTNSKIASFHNRDDARARKRTAKNAIIFDNLRAVVIR